MGRIPREPKYKALTKEGYGRATCQFGMRRGDELRVEIPAGSTPAVTNRTHLTWGREMASELKEGRYAEGAYWVLRGGVECVMEFGPDGSGDLQWWAIDDSSPVGIVDFAFVEVLDPIPTREELRELRALLASIRACSEVCGDVEIDRMADKALAILTAKDTP